MYFRKYFEGTLSNTSYTANVIINGTSSSIKTYIYQTQVINEAIKETLLAAGVSCEYDHTKHILCIDGAFVQILAVSATGNWSIYVKGNASAVTGTASGYGIGSGTNYKFYVTLQGDPKGILSISIGYYSNPGLLNGITAIAKILDLRDMSRKFGVMSGGGNLNIYLYNESGEQLNEIGSLKFSQLENYTGLTNNGSLIPLLESVDTTGCFKIEQCYMGHKGLGNNNFYNIGGEIFFHLSNYYLIKCTTEVS